MYVSSANLIIKIPEWSSPNRRRHSKGTLFLLAYFFGASCVFKLHLNTKKLLWDISFLRFGLEMAHRADGANNDLSTTANFVDVETLLDCLLTLRLSNTDNGKQSAKVIETLMRIQMQRRLIAVEGDPLRRLWTIWMDILATGQSSITNLEQILLSACSDAMFTQNMFYHTVSMTKKYEDFKSTILNTKSASAPTSSSCNEDAVSLSQSRVTAPTLVLDASNRPVSAGSLQGKIGASWVRSGGDIKQIYDSRDVIQKLVRYSEILFRV